MANIALLNRCNLSCPYCFANGYLEDEKSDITRAALLRLLDFCALEREVGIMGGEPLLHKDFDELLKIVNNDLRFQKITVFTNGVFIDKHLDSLDSPKICVLVNANSRDDMGDMQFNRMDENIGLLLKRTSARVSLGINVYKVGQDFSDFIYLLKKHRIEKIRVSVVIPNMASLREKKQSGIDYFMEMKPTLLNLYRELINLRVSPYYDCNAIPECVYTEEEKRVLEALPFYSEFERQIFLGKRSVCSPVIDLYPDMTATRCFGCYGMGRVKIEDFDSIFDLKNYFFKEIDSRLVHPYAWDKCRDCYKYKTFGCFGGCLCYKENR